MHRAIFRERPHMNVSMRVAVCLAVPFVVSAQARTPPSQAGARRELVWSAPGQEILTPRFSPDGEAIVLVTRGGGPSNTRKIDPRFDDPIVKVIDFHGTVICEVRYGWNPSLSRDHKRLVYSEQVRPITGLRTLASTMAGNGIRMYDCETKRSLGVADPQGGYLDAPLFSPEGESILYTRNEPVNGSFGGA